LSPVTLGEFLDVEDPLGWDGDGWDELFHDPHVNKLR
jgi:hypothetical protein